MLAAARKIAQYTAGLAFTDFAAAPKTIDAVVRNLSIVGEAARHIPDSVQALSPSIPGRPSAACGIELFTSTLRLMLPSSGTQSRMIFPR